MDAPEVSHTTPLVGGWGTSPPLPHAPPPPPPRHGGSSLRDMRILSRRPGPVGLSGEVRAAVGLRSEKAGAAPREEGLEEEGGDGCRCEEEGTCTLRRGEPLGPLPPPALPPLVAIPRPLISPDTTSTSSPYICTQGNREGGAPQAGYDNSCCQGFLCNGATTPITGQGNHPPLAPRDGLARMGC